MMASSAIIAHSRTLAGRSLAAVFMPLHAVLSAPVYLFLATLTVMLFRPPDIALHHLDRIAFAILVFTTVLRALWLRLPLVRSWSLTVPMLALAVLATCSAAQQPYNPQTWSLLFAEFIVPFVLFHLAATVFDDSASRRIFEIFALIVLGYLILQAFAFLVGAKWLILPRYILDGDLGIHIDRARGPFLQAVANGVTLIILGLVAFDCYRRRAFNRATLFLLCFTPIAIFATLTRAVWIAAVASLLGVTAQFRDSHVRRLCAVALVALPIGLIILLSVPAWRETAVDRASESGPVEIRAAVYDASWELIRERPLLGWGQNQMPAEVARRMSDYDLEAYWAHNTYLEILVEHGLVGLALYGWIVIALFRLSRGKCHSELVSFTAIWPVVLGAYAFNAVFVVMNYQFVNALLYTIAGIVAATARASNSPQHVR